MNKRRRECGGCSFRFWTFERPDLIDPASYIDKLEQRLVALGFSKEKIAELLAP